jgi:hypothetical protein
MKIKTKLTTPFSIILTVLILSCNQSQQLFELLLLKKINQQYEK